jgi:hypothetical protein
MHSLEMRGLLARGSASSRDACDVIAKLRLTSDVSFGCR